ncbi:MAG: hypothetical protein P1U77_24045 [Rubripirellula sp.]|nr:hypothetical protein [Planctomycetaceae bacterium]MDF1844501.1 hypothetical protein [Rubripirellula sp.]
MSTRHALCEAALGALRRLKRPSELLGDWSAWLETELAGRFAADQQTISPFHFIACYSLARVLDYAWIGSGTLKSGIRPLPATSVCAAYSQIAW